MTISVPFLLESLVVLKHRLVASPQRYFSDKRVNHLFEDPEKGETDIYDILVWEKRSKSMIRDYKLPGPKQDSDWNDPQHPDKCKFCVTEVTYLGHKLLGGGVQPDQTKIEAIINMLAPQSGVQKYLEW